MRNSTLITVLLAVLLCGCTTTASRLEGHARVCAKAMEIGELELAEDTCQRALGESDKEKDELDPGVRSQRLYELARIKRQLARYSEAGELLAESLAIEQTLSGAGSSGVTRRLMEMSLVHAGQRQWPQAAEVLERAIPGAQQLTESEQLTLGRIIKRCTIELERTGQSALALRLEAAALQLSAD